MPANIPVTVCCQETERLRAEQMSSTNVQVIVSIHSHGIFCLAHLPFSCLLCPPHTRPRLVSVMQRGVHRLSGYRHTLSLTCVFIKT